MSRTTPLKRRLLTNLGLVVAAALLAPTRAPAQVDQDPLAKVLVDLADERDEVSSPARLQIEERGVDLVPDFLALLSGEASVTVEGFTVTPGMYAKVAAVLRARSTSLLLAQVQGALGGDALITQRLAALRLLGATADASAIPTILALVGEEPGSTLGHPRISKIIEDALAGVLERDMRGHGILGAELPQLPAALRPAVAAAIGRARGPFGVPLLARMTGDGLAQAAIEAVGQWEPWSTEALDGSCGDFARPFLTAGDALLCRSAIAALGELRDRDSISTLIQLLGDTDPRVRRGAHWSLKRITGRSWSAEASRWERWHRAEKAWFAERGVALSNELVGDMAQATRALREIAQHGPLERSLLDAVAALLEHQRAPVAVAAASTLLQLGDPAAVEGLLTVVEDRRVPVREAANAALARITGRAPTEQTAAAWRAALGI